MSNFKGTKGPWIHVKFIDGQNSVRTVDDTRKICVPRVQNRDESDANMLLISKAPEMLEMLEKLHPIFKELNVNPLANEIEQLIKSCTEL